MAWEGSGARGFLRVCALWLCLGASAPAVYAESDPPPMKTLRYRPQGLSAEKATQLRRSLASDPDLMWRRMQRPAEVLQRLGPHGVSQKGAARRARRERLLEAGKISSATADTLQVLLIRIAFESDRSGSLTSITEDGNFLLRAPTDEELFDPPPHDKAYFEAHMKGLAEYWSSQSSGRLVVDARVLPEGDQDAYFLSDIADYGPGSGGFWDIDRLVALVQAMIDAADKGTQADGSVNLACYDFDDPNTYIIFAHAGGDIQSNLVFQPGDPDYSPNDIPTFFVQLGDQDSMPISSIDPDSGEPGLVTECSVIPESTSQDGLIGSIAAALYHEFGHALGLPDLYSTLTGLPSLGWWEIMDSGTNLPAGIVIEPDFVPEACDDSPEVVSVFGLLPPSTSAWCKWYLGWQEPVTVGGGTHSVTLRPSYRPQDPDRMLRIDSGGDEFFLVEHRFNPPTIPQDEIWFLEGDPASGVVLRLSRVTNPEAEPDDWITENSNMYDFFLPWPGGVFVYRIRQDRIAETLPYNAVQWRPELAGITLVEADGIQDIGRFDFRTLGFWGSEYDAFRVGEQFVFDGGVVNGEVCEDFFVEWPTTATSISGVSQPSTRSSLGMETGAWISGVGRSQDAPMNLKAGVEGVLSLDDAAPGFPIELGLVAGSDGDVPLRGVAESLTFFEFDAGPTLVFGAAGSDGLDAGGLYAFGLDGSPLGAQARRFDLGAALVGAPIALPSFDGAPALLALTADGTLHAYGSDENERSGFPVAMGGSVDLGPVWHSGAHVYAGLSGGTSIHAVDANGEAHPEYDFGLSASLPLRSAPLPADLDGDGAVDELVFVRGEELMGTEYDGAPLAGFPVALPGVADAARLELRAWPRAMDADDIACIADFDSTGAILRARERGGNWSVDSFVDALDGGPRPGVACADLDGNGDPELIVTTSRVIHVINREGFALRGWPRRLEDEYLVREFVEEGPRSAPLVADVDADGRPELMVVSRLGLIHAFDALGQKESGYPRRASGPAEAPLLLDVLAPAPRRVLMLLEARGDSLADGARLQSARLNALVLGAVPASAQSEWRAYGADLARSGRLGASAVGDVDLAATEKATVAPNPAPRDGRASVRFYAGIDHVARVDVYNLEGEQVGSREQPVLAGGAREIPFDLAGLTPGAYLCRLRYRGAGGAEKNQVLTFYVE